MLKEREEQIREDYDKVLASKLAGKLHVVGTSLCSMKKYVHEEWYFIHHCG